MTDHPLTPLGRWMQDNGVRDQWLADRIGCTQSQACRIRRGKSLPSLAGAVAIEKATKGKVRAADLLIGALPANDQTEQERAA